MEYAVWRYEGLEDDLAWIEIKLPEELDARSHHLAFGIPSSSWFPEGVVLDLSADHGIRLADAVPNAHSLLVVSEKLKKVLENCGATFEFFEVKLRNQRGRMVPEPFFVAHLLDIVECVDKEQSEFEMSHILRDQVLYFSRCVLDETRIPERAKIFRLQEKKKVIIVTVSFAREIIRQHKCVGIYFQQLEHYGKEFRK